jgi:hypothetical protein
MVGPELHLTLGGGVLSELLKVEANFVVLQSDQARRSST